MRYFDCHRFGGYSARMIGIAFLFLAAAAAAERPEQTPAAPGGAVVTIDFRAVTADGKPVLDLKAADVALKVDGRAREIRSLELIQAGSAPAAPPPFASNAAMGGREILLVLDDESIVPGKETQMKEAVGQLMAGLSARDRVGLLTLSQGGANISPTSRHDAIRAAVTPIVGHLRGSENESDFCIRTRVALQTLKSLFTSASGTIVFFSSGLMPSSGESQAQIGSSSGLCQITSADFREVANAAGPSRASLYVVHATDGMEAPRPTPTNNRRQSNNNTANNDPTAGIDSLAGVTSAETIRLVGGVEAIARVVRETSASYVVAFEPDPSDRNGSTHKIDLRVGRDGVKVRAHAELMIPKTDAKPAAAAAATPRDMLRVAQAYRDLPLRATAYPSRNTGDEQVKIVTVFEPLDPSATLASAMVGLFDDKEKLVAQWTAQAADLAKRPVVAALVRPAGVYRVRVASVDKSGRAGTVDDSVRAEISRADPVRLSGLVLGTADAGAFGWKLQFGAEQAAVGLLEIYGAAKATVAVTLELAESEDAAAIATAPTTISPPNAQEVRVAYGGFSIGALPAGDYVVRAVVSVDGKPVGRSARTLRKVVR